ncbi:IPT/TIG domain-containing protein, partial [Streptomyces sp. NPDC056512]|uniref:IPT/TIG domain-containing protein n=1 Tax=Streptomyces sp. NPDC056512 TaxID=3345846 RepID=UPI00369400E1
TTPSVLRKDLVYLDVSLVEEDGTIDRELLNSEDVGVRTSVRLKPAWVVRVREGSDEVPDPPKGGGHAYHRLALLTRPAGKDTIDPSDIRDLRTGRLTVSDLESRLSHMERLLAYPRFTPVAPFTPKSGVVNQQIILNGDKFDLGAATVFFGTQEAFIQGAPTATEIVARVPPGLTPPEGGPVEVEVSITNAVGRATATGRFTVTPDPVFAPSGGQFSPDHGVPETEVTLFGFNFGFGTPEVKFGEMKADDVLSVSATKIRVRVPDGLVPLGTDSIDVPITVHTDMGETTSDDLFKAEPRIPKPTFGAVPFTPKIGQVGQAVTLTGTNFNIGTLKVFFGAKEAGAPLAVPTATQIVVKVPAGLPEGPVEVKVQTLGGTVTSPVKFTVQS